MKVVAIVCLVLAGVFVLSSVEVPRGEVAPLGTDASSAGGTRGGAPPWDAVYDARWAYPEDATPAWTALYTGIRQFSDGGDVLNQTMLYGAPIPPGLYRYERRPSGITPERGFMVEARASVFGGSKSEVIFGAQIDFEFGACGTTPFPCGTWPEHWVRMTSAAGPSPYTGYDKTVSVSAGYHTVRLVGGRAVDGISPVKWYIDGALAFQGAGNFPTSAFDFVQVESLNYNATMAAYTNWDYWAVKFSATIANPPPVYPLPHVLPTSFHVDAGGTRNDFYSWYAFEYEAKSFNATTPAAHYSASPWVRRES